MAAISCVHSLRWLPDTHSERPIIGHLRAYAILPHKPSTRLVVVFSRRRNSTASTVTSSNKKKKKQQRLPYNDVTEDDLEEDAIEALFSQLEEDLKNDDPSFHDSDDEICEEDLAQLELELEEALGDDKLLGSLDSPHDHEISNDAEDDDDEQDEEPLKLKTWQLRRLASALKDGRRKISIKTLAGDVCLDRTVVLKLLRDPPPDLLLMSAALPDKPASEISEPENKPTETILSETALQDVPETQSKMKMPVHVIQNNWSAQKRLKKVQLETLERVYNRTKRPTNAIVSSIVHVTNLPRKKVVKWFEDKRAEDGVPEHRRPYQRDAVAESVFNS